MELGDGILAIINFIATPTWHLVIFYIIVLLLVVWSMLKAWGFKA